MTQTLKINHITYNARRGGVYKAVERIHAAQQAAPNLSSTIHAYLRSEDYIEKYDANWTVCKLNSVLARCLHTFHNKSGSKVSTNVFAPIINKNLKEEADIIHCHWVWNGLTRMPPKSKSCATVLTLHDLWPFTGYYHYPTPEILEKYSSKNNKTDFIEKLFLGRFVAALPRGLVITAPSTWMLDLANSVEHLKCFKKYKVPNLINTNFYKPFDLRQNRSLPVANPVILFGAHGGLKDYQKGGDIFVKAVNSLAQEKGYEKITVLSFGKDSLVQFHPNVEHKQMGFISSETQLRALYQEADVFVVPSRFEAFGQTALEAIASGTPVAGFRNGGLSDVCKEGITGCYSTNVNVSGLAKSIVDTLNNFPKDVTLSEQLANYARENFGAEIVIEMLTEAYMGALEC